MEILLNSEIDGIGGVTIAAHVSVIEGQIGTWDQDYIPDEIEVQDVDSIIANGHGDQYGETFCVEAGIEIVTELQAFIELAQELINRNHDEILAAIKNHHYENQFTF